MVKVTELSKSFGSKLVLNHISFSCEPGAIFALIGPNGAGKTTTLRILRGSLPADSGEVVIAGKRHHERSKHFVASVAEKREVFTGLTHEEYLKIWRLMYPKFDDARFDELCRQFSFPMNERLENASMGRRTIFMIALALSAHPDLAVLDEPFQHLDPMARADLAVILRNFSASGGTVILSSHELHEMEEVIDSFAIIKNGCICYTNTLSNAKFSHRLITGGLYDARSAELIGPVLGDLLVKGGIEGREPTLKDIALGYLNRSE